MSFLITVQPITSFSFGSHVISFSFTFVKEIFRLNGFSSNYVIYIMLKTIRWHQWRIQLEGMIERFFLISSLISWFMVQLSCHSAIQWQYSAKTASMLFMGLSIDICHIPYMPHRKCGVKTYRIYTIAFTRQIHSFRALKIND